MLPDGKGYHKSDLGINEINCFNFYIILYVVYKGALWNFVNLSHSRK